MQLHEIILGELSTRRDFWQDALFPIYHLLPILHKLLSFNRFSIYSELCDRRIECFRLAAILYINNLRARFGFEPGGGMLYGSKLQMMLRSAGMMPTWDHSNIVLIWILTVAASSSTLFAELRAFFTARLKECLQYSRVRNLSDFVAMITEFLWNNTIFGADLRILQDQLQLN